MADVIFSVGTPSSEGSFPPEAHVPDGASAHCGWRMNRVDDGIGGRADRALKFDLEQWLRPWGG